MKLRERFDAWVQGMVDAAVARRMPDPDTLMINAVRSVDRKDLAWHVDTPEFRKNVAQFVKESVVDSIDTGRIAEQIAETISAEDVAYHMDAEDVAGHVDVDADEIAEKVAGEIDVASCIDYDQLAEKLVEKLKEAWA
jgi:hypothetical protein